jgi:hypothetical protein
VIVIYCRLHDFGSRLQLSGSAFAAKIQNCPFSEDLDLWEPRNNVDLWWNTSEFIRSDNIAARSGISSPDLSKSITSQKVSTGIEEGVKVN